MDLVSLLIALIIVGAILYGVSLLPIVAIVAIAIWLLRAFAPALTM